ncbi:hypothetical protein ACFV4P_35400 [Kitasatospora sp. NPDC059795]|uniref:hypothetical protein n=1 Tax=Kitasatospora sp. NPDC059795 TaxID=3346949 RepID=UPI00364EFD24
MTYVSEESARRIRDNEYIQTPGVRELARAYLELLAEAGRVAALGEEWMEAGPETESYGRRLFDVINDEDGVHGAPDGAAAGDHQDVADGGGGRCPGLTLV